MKNQNKEISFLLQLDALMIERGEEIDGIEWIDWRGSPHLVVSSHQKDFKPSLQFFSVENPPRLLSENTLMLPPQTSRPQWSLMAADNGSFFVALTRPGSAFCPLALWDSNSPKDIDLSAQRLGGVFSNPRFVKGMQGVIPPVIAVDGAEASKAVVLFTPPESGDSWNYRVLYKPETGVVQQAEMIRIDDGYWLFYKLFVPGSVESDSQGAIPSRPNIHFGTIAPGILSCARFDGNFNILGSPFRPLNDDLFFEFDVDLCGERLVVLGTTDSGILISEGCLVGDAFQWITKTQRNLTGLCSEPTVIINGNSLYIALVEDLGSPTARVLYARR
ncbi:MAG: hypothetical protein KJ970_11715 [Candidatus Eisenbacteria bacterium]|uniref:Uncharacterized protein n=1 Tax=Eiseniibacteriota bacterium TaxID=2212470 RepID=A0A948W6X1_UNCEI|nr:hypothetical protein [Candidatus Eisenbacteria bacterium]MBU1950785.1 hypothetical protein [Candidatus Eisenbacteria bacterium]MBU2691585.1 hypothetical protein [Candidatus Eisenbacteria bacterium]